MISLILLLLIAFIFVINCHFITSLECYFDSSKRCHWSIDGNYTKATKFDGTFNPSDPERFILFQVKNNLSSFTDQHSNSVIIATLRSESLNIDEISKTGQCSLHLTFKMKNFEGGHIKIVRQVQGKNKPETELKIIPGTNDQRWNEEKILIGNIKHSFNLLIEITLAADFKFDSNHLPSIAIKKIRFVDFNNESVDIDDSNCVFKCFSNQACISRDQICNIVWDCPEGEDEDQDCDQLPIGAYCQFNNPLDNCGWHSTRNNSIVTIKNGSLYIQLSPKTKFGDGIGIKSPEFPALPLFNSLESSKYFQSCRIRFSYLLPTTRSLKIGVFGVEKNPRYYHGELFSVSTKLHQNRRNNGPSWKHSQLSLPPQIKYNFSILIEVIKHLGKDLIAAIDNITLSKECFGLGVPLDEPRVALEKAYPTHTVPISSNLKIPWSANSKKYIFTNCNTKGRIGPNLLACQKAYANTSLDNIQVNSLETSFSVSQIWSVPKSGTYSLFARGARGGHGQESKGGHGSLISAVFTFSEAETIYLTVGQAGDDACSSTAKNCKLPEIQKESSETLLKNRNGDGGGGGGGGGTFVFKFDRNKQQPIPLLIAGGGGGGGYGVLKSTDGNEKNQANGQNSKGIIDGLKPKNGKGLAGGGGWNGSTIIPSQGHSLLENAFGGLSCDTKFSLMANGGFGGGGGGGCSFGGGGGGYIGGESSDVKGILIGGGEGGVSFVNKNLGSLRLFRELTKEDDEIDDGLVVAFYQIENCCDNGENPCIVLGEQINEQNQTELVKTCVCSYEFSWPTCKNIAYKMLEVETDRSIQILTITSILLFLFIFFSFIVFFLFRYKSKLLHHGQNVNHHQCVGRDASITHLLSNSSTEMQLSRTRNGRSIFTEFNPNYEFGGSTCTLQDLREISRDKLTLVKPLGQGAFGEVYQGYLVNSNSNGEANNKIPVAVKTLPDFTSINLFEMDFLMEALIMSKFKHRNIVSFIGVSFEKTPCFIVLELLAGGDLKNFLRYSRGTIDKLSPLCFGDLLVIALDVARGCQYLEENHFIHRDIAARNCLLTVRTKNTNSTPIETNGVFNIDNYNNGFNNSGIVVKIADFGMARDIYRADYYRKGGKAMLPVKWMPPEAFLDGMFSSKTDVWSFGVLLWEVMSLGLMPYPGRGNQEVMQLVTAGKRLEPPNRATPSQVYAIMLQCWNSQSELRPNFATIIERLGYCLVDPDVLSKPLPIFIRLDSSEIETNLSQQSGESSLYLLPNGHSMSNSSYSIMTDASKLISSDASLSFNNDDSSRMMYILEEEGEATQEESSIISLKKSCNSKLQEKLEPDCSQDNQLILSTISLNERPFSQRYINIEMNEVAKG